MTYRKLLEALLLFTEGQLDLDVTLYDVATDEYYPVKGVEECSDVVLEDNHPFLDSVQQITTP